MAIGSMLSRPFIDAEDPWEDLLNADAAAQYDQAANALATANAYADATYAATDPAIDYAADVQGGEVAQAEAGGWEAPADYAPVQQGAPVYQQPSSGGQVASAQSYAEPQYDYSAPELNFAMPEMTPTVVGDLDPAAMTLAMGVATGDAGGRSLGGTFEPEPFGPPSPDESLRASWAEALQAWDTEQNPGQPMTAAEIQRIVDARIQAEGGDVEAAIDRWHDITNPGRTWETVFLESMALSGALAPLRGAGIVAKLLGPGAQSVPRFVGANVAADLAGEAGARAAQDAGLPWYVQVGAGLLAGGTAGLGVSNAPTPGQVASRAGEALPLPRGAETGDTLLDDLPDAFRAADDGGSPPVSAPAPGNDFVGELRPLPDVIDEVVTSDNAVINAIAGGLGINPSVARGSDVGRALTGYMRQRVAIDELADTAVSSALDVHAQRFTGRLGGILPISDDGLMAVSRGGIQGQAPWQDVFSRPGNFDLSPKQLSYIEDFHRVIDEAEAMRVAAGLKPRAKTGDAGWFYTPRQVENVRGVDIQRPSSANLQRIYDDAVEGFARGVRYDKDPRATLQLHLKAAYKEIAEKQLSDALEPLSLGPKELVTPTVRSRMEAALKNRQQVERQVRKDIEQARKNLARPASTPRQIANRKKDLAALDQLVKYDGPARIDAARTAYQTAKTAYSKAMEAARKAEIAPGALFGRTDETIGVGQWRNRFFPREDAETLNEAIGRVAKGDVAWPGRAAEAGGKLINYTRFLSSVGDFAAPFIQGLPVLATDPVAWGKATALHYAAFFDPTVQARFVRNHIETFQDMARHGVPIGDPEFFRAAEQGGGFNTSGIARAVPGGETARNVWHNVAQQSFGRFGSSYSTMLGSARALLWDASKMAPEEKAQWIRNLTGGLDSRAIGVGPNQREVEGLWMAFSPRLMRSTLGLLYDAARPYKGPRQRAALRSLAQLAAGATATYVATGFALGKDWEEIEQGLNPLNGKHFLSHEINGDHIGIGGQIRAASQLIAGAMTNPESLLSLDRFENPLLSYISGRGAPALNLAQNALEGLSGGKWNTNPYESIDGLPDLLKHTGLGSLPFAVQGILEGQNALTAGAAMIGFRTSPQTAGEAVEAARGELEGQYGSLFPPEIANAIQGIDYYELGPRERRVVDEYLRKENPGLLEKLEDYRREQGNPFQAARDEIAEAWQKRGPELDRLLERVKSGDSAGVRYAVTQIESGMSEVKNHIYGRQEYVDALKEIPDTDLDRLIDTYFQTYDIEDRETGAAVRERLVEKVKQADPALGARLEYNVAQYAKSDEHPLLQLYDEAQTKLTDYNALPAGKARTDYRQQNPQADFLLWYLGYTETVFPGEAADMAEKTGKPYKVRD